MRQIQILNHTHPLSLPVKVAYCSSFMSRLRGLMFAKQIHADEGILLVENLEGKINTTIHMLFMNFDIAAVWIDSNHTVVDTRIARRWRPYYAPSAPARYILETHPDRLPDFHIGDRLEFLDA
jgi:uncharacterized membrane protein (UPF0127 family)